MTVCWGGWAAPPKWQAGTPSWAQHLHSSAGTGEAVGSAGAGSSSPVLILAGAVPVPVVLREKRDVVFQKLMFQPKPGNHLLCLAPWDNSQRCWYGSIPHNFGQLPGGHQIENVTPTQLASYDEYRWSSGCPAFSETQPDTTAGELHLLVLHPRSICLPCFAITVFP